MPIGAIVGFIYITFGILYLILSCKLRTLGQDKFLANLITNNNGCEATIYKGKLSIGSFELINNHLYINHYQCEIIRSCYPINKITIGYKDEKLKIVHTEQFLPILSLQCSQKIFRQIENCFLNASS